MRTTEKDAKENFKENEGGNIDRLGHVIKITDPEDGEKTLEAQWPVSPKDYKTSPHQG